MLYCFRTVSNVQYFQNALILLYIAILGLAAHDLLYLVIYCNNVIIQNKDAKLRILNFALTAMLALLFASCGGQNLGSQQGGSGGSTGGWSALGVNTVTSVTTKSVVNHSEYSVGQHSKYACNDCHSIPQTGKPTKAATATTYVPREQICASCHPFSKYSSTMTSVDHVKLNTGTHCNGCHNSTSGVSGSSVSGWRWSSVAAGSKTRVPHAQWHNDVAGKCLDCHTAANEAVPSTHPTITSTTACETCHTYNNGTWKGAKGHSAVTTGCAACHASKGTHTLSGTSVTVGATFSGTDCSVCHQPSITSGYLNWKGAVGSSFHASLTGACTSCHTPSSTANYPAGHSTTGCESCHTYNNGSWKGAKGHSAVTSGCTACHASKGAHTLSGTSVTVGATFSGTDCSVCHQPSITSGYLNWKGALGSSFHGSLTGACTSCHTPSSAANYPSGHYTTGCEACHTYNNGSWKGAKGHVATATGCRATGCHSGHYNPYNCEWCHSRAISGGYTSWTGWGHRQESNSGCAACHGAGGGGGD